MNNSSKSANNTNIQESPVDLYDKNKRGSNCNYLDMVVLAKEMQLGALEVHSYMPPPAMQNFNNPLITNVQLVDSTKEAIAELQKQSQIAYGAIVSILIDMIEMKNECQQSFFVHDNQNLDRAFLDDQIVKIRNYILNLEKNYQNSNQSFQNFQQNGNLNIQLQAINQAVQDELLQEKIKAREHIEEQFDKLLKIYLDQENWIEKQTLDKRRILQSEYTYKKVLAEQTLGFLKPRIGSIEQMILNIKNQIEKSQQEYEAEARSQEKSIEEQKVYLQDKIKQTQEEIKVYQDQSATNKGGVTEHQHKLDMQTKIVQEHKERLNQLQDIIQIVKEQSNRNFLWGLFRSRRSSESWHTIDRSADRRIVYKQIDQVYAIMVAINNELARCKGQQEESDIKVQNRQKYLSLLQKELEQLQNNTAEEKALARQKRFRQQQSELKSELEQAENKLECLQKEIAHQESSLAQMREQIENIQKTIENDEKLLQRRIQEIQEQLTALKQQLHDDIQMGDMVANGDIYIFIKAFSIIKNLANSLAQFNSRFSIITASMHSIKKSIYNYQNYLQNINIESEEIALSKKWKEEIFNGQQLIDLLEKDQIISQKYADQLHIFKSIEFIEFTSYKDIENIFQNLDQNNIKLAPQIVKYFIRVSEKAKEQYIAQQLSIKFTWCRENIQKFQKDLASVFANVPNVKDLMQI